MLLPQRVVLLSLTYLLIPLASCANSPLGETLQRSVAPDPQLEENPVTFGSPSSTESPSPLASPAATPGEQLPADFPAEVPRYPNAELVEVSPAQGDGTTETQWTTTDAGDRVRQFYQDTFRSENWQVEQPSANAEPNAESNSESLIAEKDGLRVSITLEPSAQDATEFTLAYESIQSTASSETPSETPGSTAAAPQPGDPDFIGPVLPDNIAAEAGSEEASPTTPSQTPSQFSDLAQTPEELRAYITDLAALGVLKLSADNNSASPSEFKPNQTITRREYARWLVAANNAIYGDRPANRIRLSVETAQPAFQDVPRTDPDFAAIQGLAEAGLIPSPLSGDSTTVTFRPDAPLTRENLILWKAPVDLRQTLPNASIEAVQQTWGFQDAARIDPRALRAVLADFQNGEQSNIRRAFGYTTLFQPKKTVTRAEAAAVLWYFGLQGEGVSAKDVLQNQQRSSGQSSTQSSSQSN